MPANSQILIYSVRLIRSSLKKFKCACNNTLVKDKNEKMYKRFKAKLNEVIYSYLKHRSQHPSPCWLDYQ